MKAIVTAMIAAQMSLAGLAFGDVEITSKEIVFSPENPSGKIARIVATSSAAEKNLFFLIKDAHGKLIACLPSGPIAAGQNSVDWDGKDASGNLAPKGQYQVFMSRDMEWQLDKTFGRDGRIGRFAIEETLGDPGKAEFKVPGELMEVRVNDEKVYNAAFYKADELWLAGKNYTFKDGVLALNPKAGFKKGDRIRIGYYFPVFFQNPWDMEIDSQDNLFVLLHWQSPEVWYELGRLLKILPKGDKPDEKFGTRGQISGFNAAGEIAISEPEKRIYLAGSDYDGYCTGVYALDTGARLYLLGGCFPGTPKTTGGSGLCLGESNKIYIRPVSGMVLAYDRTKATKSVDDNGYLYSSPPTGRADDAYPALTGVYWGPSLASAASKNVFYMSAYSSTLYKIMDTGDKFTVLYSLAISGDDPIGMSLAPELNLLFAAPRCRRGEVVVIADNGSSLKEVTRLKDPELGGLHTVKWHNGFLYVLEDGAAIPDGFVTDYLRDRPDVRQGKNRISRYSVGFGKETTACTITRE